MREIETIAAALKNVRREDIYLSAFAALTTLEAEIARLRECALDLSGVPKDWEFIALNVLVDGDLEVTLRMTGNEIFDDIEATGPTPRAALENAIGRIPK